MPTNDQRRRLLLPAAAIFALSLSLSGCGGGGGSADNVRPPETSTYFGVNLDWGSSSPAAFNGELGHQAAVFVRFFQFPLTPTDLDNLDATLQSVAAESAMAMITLEPHDGLDQVTAQSAADFAAILAGFNDLHVPILVRFGHEMNGSWYPWGQDPVEYIRAFRALADAIHVQVPTAAMVWAPNYGGGYPFAGGAYGATASEPAFQIMDTNDDDQLTMDDDPYGPYYPGDDVVDWVGISLYHWGSAYPWGENEVPESGKFIAQLTGTYVGLGGDDGALPDFYATYSLDHSKPIAITETAALFNTEATTGADELTIKQAWWRQVFDRATLAAYPGIRMINWFEHAKPESELGGVVVDWRALGSDAIAIPFRADLPIDLLTFAD